MKALNLKSISWSLVVSAILCMMSFAACSDDDEEGVAITFPELKEEVHAAGETLNISFNAAADWQLTSKASWYKFVNGDFKETIVRGKAGEQTVKAEISDEGLDYSNDNTTELVLKIGVEEQVIYKITRSKKAFGGLVVKSVPEAEGEEAVVYSEGNPIVVKGCDVNAARDGYLLIEASLEDADLTVGINEGDNPDWVNVEKADNGFKLSFNRNNAEGLKFNHSIGADKGGNIKFSVMTTDNSLIGEVSIPVVYEGLKEGVIEVEPAYGNLSVSTDGLTFTEIPNGSSTGGSTTLKTYEEELVSTITARDDKFHVLVGSAIQKDVLGATAYEFDFTEKLDWVNVQTTGEKVTVATAALGTVTEQRGAVVLVLTESAWEKVQKGDINKNLIDVDGWGEHSYHAIKDEYLNGAMSVLIQEPEKQVGSKITLAAFYAQDVADWSKVTKDDLMPIDQIDGSLISGQEAKDMLEDAEIDTVGEELYILSVPNFIKGSSFCIQIDNIPADYLIGMMETPWKDDEVECHEETINGKRYWVMTGLKDGIEAPESPCALMVMSPEDTFPVECYFMFY